MENDKLREFYEQLYAQAAPPKANSIDSKKLTAILNKVRHLKMRKKSVPILSTIPSLSITKANKKTESKFFQNQYPEAIESKEYATNSNNKGHLWSDNKGELDLKITNLERAAKNLNPRKIVTAIKNKHQILDNISYGKKDQENIERAFSIGAMLRENIKSQQNSDILIQKNSAVDNEQENIESKGKISKGSNTPELLKSYVNSHLHSKRTSSTTKIPEEIPTIPTNRLIPKLKTRLRLNTNQSQRELIKQPINEQPSKNQNSKITRSVSRPKFSDAIFSDNFDAETIKIQRSVPKLLFKHETHRWYDNRPRLIINSYYRRNYVANYAKKKDTKNIVTVAELWQDMPETNENKILEDGLIKGFENARLPSKEFEEYMEHKAFLGRKYSMKEAVKQENLYRKRKLASKKGKTETRFWPSGNIKNYNEL